MVHLTNFCGFLGLASKPLFCLSWSSSQSFAHLALWVAVLASPASAFVGLHIHGDVVVVSISFMVSLLITLYSGQALVWASSCPLYTFPWSSNLSDVSFSCFAYLFQWYLCFWSVGVCNVEFFLCRTKCIGTWTLELLSLNNGVSAHAIVSSW